LQRYADGAFSSKDIISLADTTDEEPGEGPVRFWDTEKLFYAMHVAHATCILLWLPEMVTKGNDDHKLVLSIIQNMAVTFIYVILIIECIWRDKIRDLWALPAKKIKWAYWLRYEIL